MFTFPVQENTWFELSPSHLLRHSVLNAALAEPVSECQLFQPNEHVTVDEREQSPEVLAEGRNSCLATAISS